MTSRLDVRFLDPASGNPGDVPMIAGDGVTVGWGAAAGGATALGDLSDVDLATTPATDGQVLVKDDASGLWVPRGLSAGTAGTASIAAADTTVVVAHGLTEQNLTIEDFQVTPTNNLGAATKFWIAAVDATNLTIAVDQAPGTGATADFTWRFMRLTLATPPPVGSWGFEAGDPTLDFGGAGFTVTAEAARSGAAGMKYSGGAAHAVRYGDTNFAAADGFHLEGWVRIATTATPSLAGLHFGGTAAGVNGYQVCIDTRNQTGPGAENSWAFQVKRNTTTIAAAKTTNVSPDAWYRIVVAWTPGTIDARLHHPSGDLINAVNVADGTYSTGRVGVYGFGTNNHYDDITLTAS